MSPEHLSMETLSALAEAALRPAGDLDIGPEALVHLGLCDDCQETLSDLSAMLAGELDWQADSLAAYEVVDIEPMDLPDWAAPEEPLLAAADSAIVQDSSALEIRKLFRSTDGAVTLTLCLDHENQKCCLLLACVEDFDTSRVRFSLPPGVVCDWPPANAFEFPLYLLHVQGWWTDIKLLYERSDST